MKTQEEVVRQHAIGPINIYKIYQEGYQDRELDDWDAFRREAAKDILCAFLSDRVGGGPNYPEFMAEKALTFADALIIRLKEK